MASQPASVLLSHACAEPQLGSWDVVGAEAVHAVPSARVDTDVLVARWGMCSLCIAIPVWAGGLLGRTCRA